MTSIEVGTTSSTDLQKRGIRRTMNNGKSDEIKTGRQLLHANWDRLQGVQSDQMRGLPMPPMQKLVPDGATTVDLVGPEKLKPKSVPVFEAIQNRRSRRRFKLDRLSADDLSFLLWATQGTTEVSAPHYTRRTVPSAGGRHSIDTYVYIDRVEGVPQGLYGYLPIDHKLYLLSDADNLANTIDRGLQMQRWNAAAVFLWSAVAYRMEWRYSIVAHKLIALDAGHLCQNLYLACECIECGTCAIGAYDQQILDEALQLDGDGEFVIYAAPVGKIE